MEPRDPLPRVERAGISQPRHWRESSLCDARIIDYTAHSWDLARAIGGDERLDEELIAYLLTSTLLLELLEWGRVRGYYAQPAQITSDASAQARWLNLTGRVMDDPDKGRCET